MNGHVQTGSGHRVACISIRLLDMSNLPVLVFSLFRLSMMRRPDDHPGQGATGKAQAAQSRRRVTPIDDAAAVQQHLSAPKWDTTEGERAMAVRTSYRTVIVCDGKDGFCPEGAVLDVNQAPNAALRRAAKTGWQTGGVDLCPVCMGGSRPAPIPLREEHPRGTVHRFPARVTGSAPDSPECPYVCLQLTA